MKKLILIGLLVLTVLVSGCSPEKVEDIDINLINIENSKLVESEFGIKYEESIEEQLKTYEYVKVTVLLKTKNVEDVDGILSSLSKDDFKLTTKSITGIGFSGEISKSGLEKLKNNPKISNISISRTGRIS